MRRESGRRHLRAPLPRVLGALVLSAVIAGCGSGSSTTSPKGTVAAFDADLAGHRDAAACELLGPTPQLVLVDADTTAHSRPSCAAALPSAGTQRTLRQFLIPAANIGHTTVSSEPGDVVALQSDKPLPVTYTLMKQHGHWLITQL